MLKLNNEHKQYKFSIVLKNKLEETGVAALLAFSDIATFHVSDKVKHHDVHVLVLKNPHQVIELEWNSSKVKAHFTISDDKIYSLFLCAYISLIGIFTWPS